MAQDWLIRRNRVKKLNFIYSMVVIVLLSGQWLLISDDKNDCFTHYVDMIIFSDNRPLQLYALLESVEAMVEHSGAGYVLYQADDQCELAYQDVLSRFPSYTFIKSQTSDDFKPLLVDIVTHLPHHYVMFALDDDIVKDFIDLSDVAMYMELNNAYGYYLGLGFNTVESVAGYQGIPVDIAAVAPWVYKWNFASGHYDWKYAHSTDMVIYRISDVVSAVNDNDYSTAGTFAAEWAAVTPRLQRGLCSYNSRAVKVSLNAPYVYNQEDLLEMFQQGFKMSWSGLIKMNNSSIMVDCDAIFIPR
jgi:hypothetical protein